MFLTPKISVIIPIYNKSMTIKNTIESVINQSYRDFELILINDGSTDGSDKIATDYVMLDSRVTYYSQVNMGVSTARNKGIELSKGEYVTFLDADDKWDVRFLEKMIKAIGKNNVCYCGHNYYINGERIRRRMRFSKGDILEDYVKGITTPNTNSWLIRKEYIDYYKIRFPVDLNWGEDIIFFLKILTHDQNITCANNILTDYYKTTKDYPNENIISRIDKDILWMERAKEYVSQNETDKIRRERVIECFDTYNIPATIIYRLYSNKNVIMRNEMILKKYEPYIKRIKMSNGLRSLKLIFYKQLVYKCK